MELLLLALALAVVALGVSLVMRHVRVQAWDRELEQAFGLPAEREMPRHRAL